MWHNELCRPSPLAFLAPGSSHNFRDSQMRKIDGWPNSRSVVCTCILYYLGMSWKFSRVQVKSFRRGKRQKVWPIRWLAIAPGVLFFGQAIKAELKTLRIVWPTDICSPFDWANNISRYSWPHTVVELFCWTQTRAEQSAQKKHKTEPMSGYKWSPFRLVLARAPFFLGRGWIAQGKSLICIYFKVNW